MIRGIPPRLAILASLPLLVFSAAASAQDRPGNWTRVQQLRTSGSVAAATQDTLARATQMQTQLDQASKTALAESAALRPKLSAAQSQTLAAIGRELAKNPSSPDAARTWREFIAAARPSAIDVNALVQWVLRESYLQQTEDLRFYAEKVKRFNDMKSKLRGEIDRANAAVAPATSIARVAPGAIAVHKASVSAAQPKAQAGAPVRALEQQLQTAGDDAQLANVDLQNILQKQQQTLQMMSNISKMLHDTAMAVIRKIGG